MTTPPFRATLASPQLNTSHPVWVYPDAYPGDDNYRENIVAIGGVTYQDHKEKYVLVWAAPRGARTYNIYGSVSPTRKTNLLASGVKTNQYEFYPPVFSEIIRYYFWVSWVDANGTETYLSEEPASLEKTAVDTAFWPNPITSSCNVPDADGINCEHKKAYDYIQHMNRLELQLNGEAAYLHIRRHGSHKPWGIPCACNDSMDASSDPDYQGRGRCSLCFGTGVFGGFFPAIPIMIRYSNAPEQVYRYAKQGLVLNHSFNTYALWEPIINVDDIVIRASDGKRFRVSKRKETSARAIRLHQEFDLTEVERTSVLYEVSDKTIQEALDQAKLPNYMVERFKIFG